MPFLINGQHFVWARTAQAAARKEYGRDAVVTDDIISTPSGKILGTIHSCR